LLYKFPLTTSRGLPTASKLELLRGAAQEVGLVKYLAEHQPSSIKGFVIEDITNETGDWTYICLLTDLDGAGLLKLGKSPWQPEELLNHPDWKPTIP
jgi:hypothetical protein